MMMTMPPYRSRHVLFSAMVATTSPKKKPSVAKAYVALALALTVLAAGGVVGGLFGAGVIGNDVSRPPLESSSSSTAVSSSSSNTQIVSSSSSSSSVPVLPTSVFLLIGSDNMIGNNSDDACVAGVPCAPYSNPNIRQMGTWTTGGYSTSGNDLNVVVPAMDPLEFPHATQNKSAMTGVGPGMSFASTYHQRTGNGVLLVPCAVAGSTVCQWTVVVDGGVYEQCLGWAQTALMVPGTSLGGIFWLGGEDDCAGSFSELIPQVIADFRSAFDNVNIPFVVGQMSRPYVAVDSPAQVALTNLPFLTLDEVYYDTGYAYDETAYTGWRTSVVYSLDAHGAPFPTSASPKHFAANATRRLGVAFDAALQIAEQNTFLSSESPPLAQVFAPSSVVQGQTMNVSWPYNNETDAHSLVVNGGVVATIAPGTSSVAYQVPNNQASPMVVQVGTSRTGNATLNLGPVNVSVDVLSAPA